ncbi:lipase family protein [Acinetobacter nematophilus]|uniref:Alpha/beta hydrolase n=1 Tax=Acinetobacter nematophilus TaxID=2994642 RepID=A0A9X3IGK1_9GAMM|nr:lipase family protein [Acinetobacter nematophilus]MCX5466344.1 alpha/beta hydrolase [Acinetobacter nematophilus]
MKLNLLSVLLAGSAVFLVACNGDDKGTNDGAITPEKPPEVEVNNIQNPVVSTPVAYKFTQDYPPNAAESVVMTYKMKGILGKETQATTLVFTPRTAPPSGGWPIVVWAHGTTGVADSCAPSQNSLISTDREGTKDDTIYQTIDNFVKEGYLVVAPDYEGLGEPGGQEIHPYKNLKSEAYSITDAVVATKSWLGNKVSNRWVVVGVSQGGHAGLGAAQYAARANMDYKGVVALAPSNNMEMIVQLSEKKLETASVRDKVVGYTKLDALTAFMAAGLKSVYPNEPVYSMVFKPPTDKIAEQAESLCITQLAETFAGAMVNYIFKNGGSLDGYPRKVDGYLNNPIVKQLLDKDSQPLQTIIKTPIIIYQGGGDTIVLPQATDAMVEKARSLGIKIDYRTDPTWNHTSVATINAKNGKILEDVKGLLAK